MRFRSSLALAAGIAQLLLISCASAPVEPTQAVAVPQPIPLGEAGSHAIIFQKVLFRIPLGTVMGETRIGRKIAQEMRWTRPARSTAEFNVAVTDAYRALGYEMRDSADALFDPAKQLKVRYELAAMRAKSKPS